MAPERISRTGPYHEVKGEMGEGSQWQVAERSYRPLDPRQILASWFDSPDVNGILFGVQHGVVDINDFVARELIPLAYDHGVRDIYDETSVTWQQDFESFRQTGQFPEDWERSLGFINQWNGNCQNDRPLYERIRQYPDLRLTFVDVPENRMTGRRLNKGAKRDSHMMKVFSNRPPHGKFLVLCGAGHATKAQYHEFNIRRERFELQNPLGYLIARKSGKRVRAAIAVGSSDDKHYPVYRFINDAVPQNHPPIALDIPTEVDVPDSILYRWVYGKGPLEEAFDCFIFFPHATYS